jgi:hypothetical protein
MATEISVTGNKKIGTLQKEFHEKFPYLRLGIFPLSEKRKKTKTPFSSDLTIATVRKGKSSGDITITGNKLVKTLEHEFEEDFGLYVQVGFVEKDGSRHYTSGTYDDLTLTACNKACEAIGCKKNVKA